jgi:hypothetical protein
MKKILPIVLFGSLAIYACTISVVDSHTEKGAQETISEDQATDPTVSPEINVPIKAPNSGLNAPAVAK